MHIAAISTTCFGQDPSAPTRFNTDTVLVEDSTDLRSILKLRDTWPTAPALIVRGVASPEGQTLPMPEWIEGELSEPFGDLALWTELAQMWSLTEEDEEETAQAGGALHFGADVLMVEDNDTNRLILEQILNTLGYQTSHAINGQEALDILRQRSFDMVLMDVQMPVMDGLTATRRIREREAAEGLPRQTIIALTANALAGDREMCLQAGMDDYVAKPVTIGGISTAMLRWLRATRIGNDTADEIEETEALPAPPPEDKAEAAALPSFDFRELRTSLGKEADRIIPNVVNSYLREGMAHIAVLSNLSGDFDLEHITRIVHNLKSSSAALGLMDFSARCKEAEQAARNQQSATLLGLLPGIVSDFVLVRSAAEKLLEELGQKRGG